jgi:hypothetical protein
MTTPKILAAAFSAALRADFPASTIAEMIERNRTYDEGACASHDFCDANMWMQDAFIEVMGRDVWWPSDVEEGKCTDAQQQQADFTLWGDAWGIAKASGFSTGA